MSLSNNKKPKKNTKKTPSASTSKPTKKRTTAARPKSTAKRTTAASSKSTAKKTSSRSTSKKTLSKPAKATKRVKKNTLKHDEKFEMGTDERPITINVNGRQRQIQPPTPPAKKHVAIESIRVHYKFKD